MSQQESAFLRDYGSKFIDFINSLNLERDHDLNFSSKFQGVFDILVRLEQFERCYPNSNILKNLIQNEYNPEIYSYNYPLSFDNPNEISSSFPMSGGTPHFPNTTGNDINNIYDISSSISSQNPHMHLSNFSKMIPNKKSVNFNSMNTSNNNSFDNRLFYSQLKHAQLSKYNKDLSPTQECLSESSLPSTSYSDSGIHENFSLPLGYMENEDSLRYKRHHNPHHDNKIAKGTNKLLPSLTKRLEKTQLCRHFSRNNRCSNGVNCAFAHSIEELRNRPDLTKTKICEDFLSGFCKFGSNCKHAHSEAELKATPEFYKTSLCPEFTQYWHCNRGENCRFAHNESELNRFF